MSKAFVLKSNSTEKSDLLMILLLILLVGFGLSALFSASHFVSMRLFGNPYNFLFSQLRWVLVGGVGAAVVSQLNLEILRNAVPYLLVISIFLMILPLFSPPLQGAQRWIVVGGFSFQPSELAKMTLILYLAHIFSKPGYDITDFKRGLLPPLVVVTVFLGLTLLQNDYSTMLFLAVVALTLFFVAGMQGRYFIILGSVGIPLSLIYLFVSEYRVLRILNFMDIFRDPGNSSYQVLSSLRALGEGGLWGRGMGAGVRKLGTLPDVQADFILASVGEEVGFLGILVLFGLFGLLFYRGIVVSFKNKKPFFKYLGLGISFSIFLQFLLNAGVVSSALPATGIPLPFFSAGGSSLLITLLMMGVLLGISRQGSQPLPATGTTTKGRGHDR
jgi:cell division protein FtsW